MSRIAKIPIIIPYNVNIKINGQIVTIKGEKGELTRIFNDAVEIKYIDNFLYFHPRKNCKDNWAQAGTARSLLNSMIIGVIEGFSKKLQLVGIGYRVAIKGNILSLSLGFSHSIEYELPVNVVAECPSQNEITLKSVDKQMVGQVAAKLRSYRHMDPYKGRGIRYVNEVIRIKDAKKK